MLNSTAICTIACENYLPFVQVLAASLNVHYPEPPFHVLLIPEGNGMEGGAIENLDVLRIEDLAIPEIDTRFRRYDKKQLSASLKPALLKYLLQQGYTTVVFLDPDMLVTASLDQVISQIAAHSLTLTPHILNPDEAYAITNLDRQILHSGMFNAGFIGVSATPETIRFLEWWEKRLADFCLNQPRRGMHYDQRWLDHVVGFVDDLHVLRDPGVNAAYWNLIRRNVEFDGEQYHVDGALLKCLHFSGFAPDMLPQATCYYPEIDISQFGPLSKLYYRYKEDLLAMGLTSRPYLEVSNSDAAQDVDGYFDLPLTSAEIRHLAEQAQSTQIEALQAVTILGEFVPVRAFSISGIRRRLGWSHDETWGIWSQGTYSELQVPVPIDRYEALQIGFLMRGFVPAAHPVQEVEVFLNGEFVEKWTFRKNRWPAFRKIRVDQKSSANGMLVFGFHMLNPASPYSLGISNDNRMLGIGLRGIKVAEFGYFKAFRRNSIFANALNGIAVKLRAWLA